MIPDLGQKSCLTIATQDSFRACSELKAEEFINKQLNHMWPSTGVWTLKVKARSRHASTLKQKNSF